MPAAGSAMVSSGRGRMTSTMALISALGMGSQPTNRPASLGGGRKIRAANAAAVHLAAVLFRFVGEDGAADGIVHAFDDRTGETKSVTQL